MSSTSDRYFDVFVEYAKQTPEDILIQISVSNRGPEAATIARPADALVSQHLDVVAGHAKAVLEAGLWSERRPRLLQRHTPNWVSAICTAREMSRCCSPRMRPTTSGSSARPMPVPYVKDGINNYVVNGKQDAVNPENTGTKVCRTLSVECGRRKDGHHPSAAERPGACCHGRSLQELR